jgi:hypothetical protein
VEEETGLSVKKSNLAKEKPLLLDIHKIPENSKKEESGHFHFDFIFIFEKEKSQEINLQLEEVSGFR